MIFAAIFCIYKTANARQQRARGPLLTAYPEGQTRKLVVHRGKVVSAPQTPRSQSRRHQLLSIRSSIASRFSTLSHERLPKPLPDQHFPTHGQAQLYSLDSKALKSKYSLSIRNAGPPNPNNLAASFDVEAQRPSTRTANMSMLSRLDQQFQRPKSVHKSSLGHKPSDPESQNLLSHTEGRVISYSLRKAYTGQSLGHDGEVIRAPPQAVSKPPTVRTTTRQAADLSDSLKPPGLGRDNANRPGTWYSISSQDSDESCSLPSPTIGFAASQTTSPRDPRHEEDVEEQLKKVRGNHDGQSDTQVSVIQIDDETASLFDDESTIVHPDRSSQAVGSDSQNLGGTLAKSFRNKWAISERSPRHRQQKLLRVVTSGLQEREGSFLHSATRSERQSYDVQRTTSMISNRSVPTFVSSELSPTFEVGDAKQVSMVMPSKSLSTRPSLTNLPLSKFRTTHGYRSDEKPPPLPPKSPQFQTRVSKPRSRSQQTPQPPHPNTLLSSSTAKAKGPTVLRKKSLLAQGFI